MCEIQFILSKRPMSDNVELMREMLNSGYANGNKCATGIMGFDMTSEWSSYKSAGSIEELIEGNKKVLKTLASSTVFIGHNRLGTGATPKNNYNNHPFNIGDWYLVHNGIVRVDGGKQAVKYIKDKYGIEENIKTDSYEFLALFVKNFEQETVGNYREKLVSALRETLADTSGSLSIFLYNETENNLVYFRNSGAYFTFGLAFDDKDWRIFGSTDSNKINPRLQASGNKLGVFEQYGINTFYSFTPADRNIYNVDISAGSVERVFSAIGTFTNATSVYGYTGSYGGRCDYAPSEEDDKETLTDAGKDKLYDEYIEEKIDELLESMPEVEAAIAEMNKAGCDSYTYEESISFWGGFISKELVDKLRRACNKYGVLCKSYGSDCCEIDFSPLLKGARRDWRHKYDEEVEQIWN